MSNISTTMGAAARAAVDTVLADAKPLTARSVVASTLLGVDPPQLPARLLVRSGELFGISRGSTRTAISRMCANGELVAIDGDYQLAGSPLTTRAHRQTLSRNGTVRAWDGSWRCVVVVRTERDAAERTALRRATSALRLAERREGVWMRPDNLPALHDHAQPEACQTVAGQCEEFRVEPVDDPAALATALFDPAGWAVQATRLMAATRALSTTLKSQDISALGDAFVVAAATSRHFQADPLLPDDLLPDDWPGPQLRADYEHFDAAFKTAWSAWFSTEH